MTAAVVTLLAGAVIGYLGQRSRMCFVGGIRDFVLVRDTYLLRGLIAFGLTAWLTFPMTGLILGSRPLSFTNPDGVAVLLTIFGGFCGGFGFTIAKCFSFCQH